MLWIFESWNKNKIKKVCLLRRSGKIQDTHYQLEVGAQRLLVSQYFALGMVS